MSPKKKKAASKKEESFTDRLQNLNITKSYTSLAYGVITVVVIFILIVVGIRAFTQQQQDGETTDDAAVTNESDTYTVQAGQSLWDISEEVYGTGFDWQKIADANDITDPDAIEEGMQLSIPRDEAEEPSPTQSQSDDDSETAEDLEDVTPTVEPTKEPTVTQSLTPTPTKTPQVGGQGEAIESKSYTVSQGDYLWDIAVRAYGDGFKWVEIYRANQDKIQNPDLIYPDQELSIPRG